MNRAFSLVELSIVLVILGLLVGGVLSGQSLIRASELRSISTDVSRYQAAMKSFRDKYFALPGDMPNAVRFWGAQAGAVTDGAVAACSTLLTPATDTATCNGNGDGKIGEASGTCYERARFWQHLANAGLIEGQFSGVIPIAFNCSASYSGSPPQVPRSRIGNAGFNVWGENAKIGAHSNYFPGFYGVRLQLGREWTPAFGWPLWMGTITPEEAWHIDTKMDDGKPPTGKVMGYMSSGAG